jgi:hypothetical protein
MDHVRIGVYALTSGTAKEISDQAVTRVKL